MKTRIAGLVGIVLAAWHLAASGSEASVVATPLPRAHSHNDYEHPRPLLDALAEGFCSVEADIYLVEGKLLVAHDRDKVKPERTLEALYLEPLAERVKRNQGRVYPGGPEFTLLIDLKTDWKATYPVLRGVLAKYAWMLTTFQEGTRKDGAVLVILSGSRAKEMFADEAVRYAGYDGLLEDLDRNDPPTLVPWVSANWRAVFKWRGEGGFAPAEREKLQGIVARAHAQHRRVRFWGAPDVPVFWQEMYDQGVDLINTDNLSGLRAFLAGQRK